MSDNKRNGRGFIGKGYYIALILCAAAIGITGYLYAQSADQTQQTAVQETQSEEIFLDISGIEDVPVIATEPKASAANNIFVDFIFISFLSIRMKR